MSKDETMGMLLHAMTMPLSTEETNKNLRDDMIKCNIAISQERKMLLLLLSFLSHILMSPEDIDDKFLHVVYKRMNEICEYFGIKEPDDIIKMMKDCDKNLSELIFLQKEPEGGVQ